MYGQSLLYDKYVYIYIILSFLTEFCLYHSPQLQMLKWMQKQVCVIVI